MTEEQVFLTALEQPTEADRNAYLEMACGGDTELRRQVEDLLAAHFRSGEFLDEPVGQQLQADLTTPAVAETLYVPGDSGGEVVANEKNTDEEGDDLHFLGPGTRPDSLGRIGHYDVLEVLGRGGFGIVFRAFDDVLQRVVALKVLAPALAATSPARKRFLREARASAKVRHDHVVQVYAVEEQPLPYLAMEFIPGETLQQRLDRTGPLEVTEIVSLARQIAEGLAAAHATDLIHRDIKPGNVLIEGGVQDRVKITDFGLARAADDASMTQSGMVAGTPMYMAPEQAKGEALDRRTDLFSLGSVMYVMASGRPPFRAATTFAVLKRVVEETPRSIKELIPETPQWLCDIIAKLHAKNPEDRFQSAREVADVLADCEQQLKQNSRVQDLSQIPRVQRQPLSHQRAMLVATAIFAIPLIVLAVTETIGLTHLLFGRPAVNHPVQKTVEPVPVAASPAPDADGWVQLFNGKDLTGWKQDGYWTVEDGMLVSRIPATPKTQPGFLTTDRSDYRDFHLRVEAKINASGDSGLFFRFGEQGDASLQAQIVPSPNHAGSLLRHADVVVPATTSIKPDTWFTMEVIAQGQKVEVYIDGKKASEWTYPSGSVPSGPIALESGFPKTELTVRKVEVKPPSPSRAAEPGWVQLFNGKDLTGWRTHPDQSSSWTVKDGAIVGRGDESYLYTVRGDYQDFHMRAKVRIGATGNSGIHFRSAFSPTIPDGYEAQINIGSDKWLTGSLFSLPLRRDAWLLNHVKESGVRPNELFTFEILAQGDHLVALVDGLVVSDVRHNKYDKGHIALQTGLRSAGEVRFSSVEIKELPPEELSWVQLFNGQDLTGWKTHPDDLSKHWTVEDGAIVGRGGQSYLFTDRGDYEDIHLRAEAQVNATGDGGLVFRTDFAVRPAKSGTGVAYTSGYEAQIGLRPNWPIHTGSLSAPVGKSASDGVLAVGPLAPHRSDEWFQLEVIAQGSHIQVFVDGKRTADYHDETARFKRGHLALQTWAGNSVIRFRKIEIKALPASKASLTIAAAQQVEEVRQELMRLNPGFDGQVGHRIEDDVVVEFSFVTDQVTDISPVRALTGLKSLSCSASDVGLGQLGAAALLPLKGLPLTNLDVRDSPALSDLSALAGMKLTSLDCRATSVCDADLQHLAGQQDLQILSLWGTKVTDAGMKQLAGLKNLQHLSLQNTKVTDKGLKEIARLEKLVSLDLYVVTGVTDAGLEHLARLRTLQSLELRGPEVTDGGVDKLAAALPALRIATWDRIIEPKVVPFTDADAQRIAALPANEQVEEVRKELVRLNPGFDGKLTPTIENDVVTKLSFNSDQVDNIAPVRALTKLVYLDCRGTYPNKGKLSDLSPIKGMKLSHIDCSSTQIADLSPLADMPLTNLQFNHNPVDDLTPLQKMPLETLGCAETKVSDFSPLKGLKLKVLGAQLLAVTDLSPLEGMPLTGIDLYHTVGVTSLAPLKGMPLEGLNLQDVPVSDLSPLAGMTSLRTLVLQATKVSDLSPLAGLKLTDLFLHGKEITDISPLKGQPLSRLSIDGTGVSDLRPLHGMSLAEFRLTPQNITQGLDILREMKSLTIIGVGGGKAWPPAEFWERYDKGEFQR